MVARFAEEWKLRLARLHERGERSKTFFRDAQPCLVIE
jgi:hypothetical protein